MCFIDSVNNITKRKKSRIYLMVIVVLCLIPVILSGQSGTKVQVVCIDPGHGGKDPGCVGKKLKEKDITLFIALKFGKLIEDNYPDVKVIYTRKEDVFVPLDQRAEIANKNKAQLFVSIHVNASETNPNASGVSSHVLGLHRADENFEIAKRENAVILLEDNYSTKYEGFDPNSPESYIIFSLMQNLFLNQSLQFAYTIQKKQTEHAKRSDRGVEQNGFLVLAHASMPAVLIENGFISNAKEEEFLATDEGRNAMAISIFNAFRDYKTGIEHKSNFTIAKDTVAQQQPQQQEQLQPETQTDTYMPLYTRPTEDTTMITFKVQILSSKSSIAINDAIFKGLDSVEEFKAGQSYKYAAGNASTIEDAKAYKKKISGQYPDAFIIAVRNHSIIPLSEALQK